MLRAAATPSIIKHVVTQITVTGRAGLVAALALLVAPQWGGRAACHAASQNERVRAELVADVSTIAPGQSFQLGVRLTMEESWHVNWSNPGDAGLAPTVQWRLPQGFTADILQWPHPGHFAVGPLVIFGYADHVLLTARVTAPPHLPQNGRIALGAAVSWVACGNSRVPGGGTLSLELAVGNRAVSERTSRWFEDARQSVPVSSTTWRMVGWYQDAQTIVFEMQSDDPAAPVLTDVFFYPYDAGIIVSSHPQPLARLVSNTTAGGYRLTIDRDDMVAAKPARLRGVIVSGSGWESKRNLRALSVDILMLAEPQ